MKQLIQQFIESLHVQGRCPRIVVNAQTPGVDLPQSVIDVWGEELPIDLDPAYPLDLSYNDLGITCTLSFRAPVVCFIPWEAIYILKDRETKTGMIVEANLPLNWTSENEANGPGGETPIPEEEPLPVRDTNEISVVPALETNDNETLSDCIDEDTAVERRARFKVIEGGSS